LAKRIRRRCSAFRNQIEIVKVYRDLNSDDEELPLPEDIDRRREAAVSPVSAFEWELEPCPKPKLWGRESPCGSKPKSKEFPNFLDGHG